MCYLNVVSFEFSFNISSPGEKKRILGKCSLTATWSLLLKKPRHFQAGNKFMSYQRHIISRDRGCRPHVLSPDRETGAESVSWTAVLSPCLHVKLW